MFLSFNAKQKKWRGTCLASSVSSRGMLRIVVLCEVRYSLFLCSYRQSKRKIPLALSNLGSVGQADTACKA